MPDTADCTIRDTDECGPNVPDMDRARPATACVLCPPPGPSRKAWTAVDRGYRTCADCYDAVRERLIDVRNRYLRLDATPGANLEHGSRGAPGFGSKPTASLHVVTMRDWRSRSCETAVDATVYVWDPLADTVLDAGQYGPPGGAYVERREVWYGSDGRPHSEQPRPPRSVPKTLAGWADLIAEERAATAPTTRAVPELARWIDGHMDWITRNDLVVDLDRDLRDLVAQLRPVTGDPNQRPVGLCPNTVDEGPTSRECRTRLYAPKIGDTIACTACGRKWPRPEWAELGGLLEAS